MLPHHSILFADTYFRERRNHRESSPNSPRNWTRHLASRKMLEKATRFGNRRTPSEKSLIDALFRFYHMGICRTVLTAGMVHGAAQNIGMVTVRFLAAYGEGLSSSFLLQRGRLSVEGWMRPRWNEWKKFLFRLSITHSNT